MVPQGPNPRQVQEFLDSVYATNLLDNLYHLEAFFATSITLMAPLKIVPFTVAWYYTGGSFAISFWYQDRYHLLNSCYQVILCDTGIAKISVVFLQYLRTDRKILQTTHYVPTRRQVTDLLQTAAYICCNYSTIDTQNRVESWYFFLILHNSQWILVQKDVETNPEKWNFIQSTLFSHNLSWYNTTLLDRLSPL